MNSLLPNIDNLKDLVPIIGIIYYMLRQVIKKLDEVVASNKMLGETVIRHSMKLEVGDREFKEISVHQKEQDKWISQLRERFHDLGNRMATKDDVITLIQLEINKRNP